MPPHCQTPKRVIYFFSWRLSMATRLVPCGQEQVVIAQGQGLAAEREAGRSPVFHRHQLIEFAWRAFDAEEGAGLPLVHRDLLGANGVAIG
jgi:hypothetical protein